MNRDGGITYFISFIRNIPLGETIIKYTNIFNHNQHALYEQLYYVNKIVRKVFVGSDLDRFYNLHYNLLS
jgi:hypothetical protein